MRTSEDAVKTSEEGAAGNGDGGAGGGEGKTFTQAELDRAIGERLARERDKYKDFDTYKAAADELAKLKDGEKTELQKLQDQISAEKTAREKAENDAKEAQLAQLRADRAAAKDGFPRSLAKKLTGTTAEEIDAEINEIMTELGPRKPEVNGNQGNTRTGDDAKPATVAAGAELYGKLHPKSQ